MTATIAPQLGALAAPAARCGVAMARRILLAVALVPALARAHQAGVSYGEVEVRGDAVHVTLRAAEAELATLVDPAPRDALRTYDVSQDGARCVLEAGPVAAEPPDGLRLSGAFRCPRRIERVTMRIGLVEQLPRGHVHLAEVRVGDRLESRVARAGDPVLELAAEPRRWRDAGRYVLLGMEHIFTGWDHLAFLVGLLLLGGSVRTIAGVVTSFTVAHSLTLALAVLGLVALPARVVEPLIAASVVYVAVENLRALRRAAGPPPSRAAIAFLFGLVHGFGFAGLLRELGLPRAGVAASLLPFSLGVELGQLAVVVVALPLLGLLRRRPRIRLPALRAGSVAIGGAGAVWLMGRVVGG